MSVRDNSELASYLRAFLAGRRIDVQPTVYEIDGVKYVSVGAACLGLLREFGERNGWMVDGEEIRGVTTSTWRVAQ
jgi:hypothetical protein